MRSTIATIGFLALAVSGWAIAQTHYDAPSGGGGGGSFDGDLATDTALTDSSDNVIDIAATDTMCWSAATCLDGTTDGTLVITNNAVGNSAGDLCLGPTGAAANPCFTNESFNAGVTDGLGNPENLILSGLNTRATMAGNTLVEFLNDSVHFEMGHSQGGYLGWNNTTGSSGSNVLLFGIENAANEQYIATSDTVTSIGNTHHIGTFRMGDMGGTSTAAAPACDITTSGTIQFNYGQANSLETAMMCVQDSDGATNAYRWAGSFGGKSHFYSDHSNSTTTSVTGSGTWDHVTISGNTLWNVGLEGGFNLNADKLDAAGNWPYESGVSRYFKVTYSMSYSKSGGGSTVYMTTIAIDDNEASPATTYANCYTERTVGSTDVGSVAATCFLQLDVDGTNNDSIYIVVQGDAANAITVRDANIVIEAI